MSFDHLGHVAVVDADHQGHRLLKHAEADEHDDGTKHIVLPLAEIKVIAFARRAIDRSLYLNKYVWQQVEYIRKNPIFQLNERERLITGHYCSLMMLKTHGSDGSFHHDVVRMLFQTLMMEFMMLVERKRETLPETDSVQDSKDAIVRQSTLIYRRFMSFCHLFFMSVVCYKPILLNYVVLSGQIYGFCGKITIFAT